MLKSMMKTKTACASFYAFLLVLLCMSMEIQSHGTYVCVQLLGYISRGVPRVSHELPSIDAKERSFSYQSVIKCEGIGAVQTRDFVVVCF